jgi:uncharacterized lipoprotein YajG
MLHFQETHMQKMMISVFAFSVLFIAGCAQPPADPTTCPEVLTP